MLAGDTIFAGHGRDGKNAFMVSLVIFLEACDKMNAGKVKIELLNGEDCIRWNSNKIE